MWLIAPLIFFLVHLPFTSGCLAMKPHRSLGLLFDSLFSILITCFFPITEISIVDPLPGKDCLQLKELLCSEGKDQAGNPMFCTKDYCVLVIRIVSHLLF